MPLGTGSDTHTHTHKTTTRILCHFVFYKQSKHTTLSLLIRLHPLLPALCPLPFQPDRAGNTSDFLEIHISTSTPPPLQNNHGSFVILSSKKKAKRPFGGRVVPSVSCFVCTIYYLHYVPYPFNQTMQEILQTSQKFTSTSTPPPPSKTTTGPLSSCLLKTRQKHHLEKG